MDSKLVNQPKRSSILLTLWRSSKNSKILRVFMIILATGVIFIAAQFLSSLILSIYTLFKHWSVTQANNWLTNSIYAQFLYVLFAEAITVGFVYLLLRSLGKNLKDIGLGRFKYSYIFYGVIIYPLFLIGSVIALDIAQHFYPGLNVNQAQQIGFSTVHTSTQQILTFISLVILAPIAEEILFKGVPKGWFRCSNILYLC